MQSEPGSPNLNGVPLCVPTLNGNEADYLRECIESGWVSSAGPFVDKLESSLASYVNRKYAVAMASGTAALHLALKTVGVREDDEVIVSDLTFIAPVNVIRYLSAYPVLVDAEKRHWQMDTRLVETFLREKCERRQDGLFNKTTGRRVAAILPVHILGHPVELNHITGLATEFGLPVVEDATESLGSAYDGELVGKKGVVSCFSFNGNKLMTSGGGGMAVTDNPDYAEKLRYLSTQAKDDPIYYRHHEVGYNYRLTNIQAAVGLAQFEQLQGFIESKKKTAKAYRELLAGLPVSFQEEAPTVSSCYWLFTILVDNEKSRDELLRFLSKRGVQSRPLWQPMHQSPALQGRFSLLGGGQVSEELAGRSLSLPCSSHITEEEIEQVASSIRDFFSARSPS